MDVTFSFSNGSFCVGKHIVDDKGALLKLGSDYFRINPANEHHLEVNMKFIKVLTKMKMTGNNSNFHGV